MVWVDIAVIILLAHYAIKGIISGCKNELFSIGVLIIGILIAWFFSYEFEILLHKLFATPTTRLAMSFISLMLLTVLIGKIVNWLLSNTGEPKILALDRIGGLCFGVAHGWIVMIALVLVAGITEMPNDRWWRQSKYLPTFQATAVIIKNTIGSKMARSINYR